MILRALGPASGVCLALAKVAHGVPSCGSSLYIYIFFWPCVRMGWGGGGGEWGIVTKWGHESYGTE